MTNTSLILLISAFFILFSCNKDSNFMPYEEIKTNTCGENTISAITSFGTYCPGLNEIGKLILDKNNNLELFFIFHTSSNRFEQFSINMTLSSLKLGENKPVNSQVTATKSEIITWSEFEISKPGQSTQFKIPLKIEVFLSELEPNFISGSYYIELNDRENFKGYFNRLVVEKQ